jgi:hypothetical protein
MNKKSGLISETREIIVRDDQRIDVLVSYVKKHFEDAFITDIREHTKGYAFTVTGRPIDQPTGKVDLTGG